MLEAQAPVAENFSGAKIVIIWSNFDILLTYRKTDFTKI